MIFSRISRRLPRRDRMEEEEEVEVDSSAESARK